MERVVGVETRGLLNDLGKAVGLKGTTFIANEVDAKYREPLVEILSALLVGKFTRPDGVVLQLELQPDARK